ncbi:hypothetical protein [Xanthobacter sediminis]
MPLSQWLYAAMGDAGLLCSLSSRESAGQLRGLSGADILPDLASADRRGTGQAGAHARSDPLLGANSMPPEGAARRGISLNSKHNCLVELRLRQQIKTKIRMARTTIKIDQMLALQFNSAKLSVLATTVASTKKDITKEERHDGNHVPGLFGLRCARSRQMGTVGG